MYKRVKLACYTTNVCMAVTANLSPILFLTFHNTYDISFSLLGLLVLINFTTQLLIDLLFSFFSHKINTNLAVKLTPVINAAGLILFALSPFIFPNNVYLGLCIGTVIFAASSGLAEVLISPVIAAIPSKNPEREMSKLHSIYAWGTVAVVLISALYVVFLSKFGWHWLPLCFTVIPIVAAILFAGAKLPHLEKTTRVRGVINDMKNRRLWICVAAIFFGGLMECTMGQWASSYIEKALSIPKIYGDIFGAAAFAVMLGLGRTLYSQIGKKIELILFIGGIGCAACYLIASLSVGLSVVGLIACAMTGLFSSMLWPGSLIVAQKRIPHGGVFMFALMAAGGDTGASLGPQLVGVLTDTLTKAPLIRELSSRLSIDVEEASMRAGLLIGFICSLIATAIFLYFLISAKKQKLIKIK